jgi:hypothetical protein
MPFLKHSLVRAVCLAQSLILMVPAAPVFAASTKTITCDSRDFERVRCDISNKSVRLKRQLSVSSCREGRDWGYDKRGVWVDNGCEAEFEVTQDSGLSGGEAAAAILIGGLLLGALAMGNDDKKAPPTETTSAATPPNWAVGGFRGRNPSTQKNEELTVEKNGQVKIIRQGQAMQAQWLNGQQLRLQNETFRAERIAGGLRLTNASGQSADYFLLD